MSAAGAMRIGEEMPIGCGFTHRRGYVTRTNVAYVFHTSFPSPRRRLLANNAHLAVRRSTSAVWREASHPGIGGAGRKNSGSRQGCCRCGSEIKRVSVESARAGDVVAALCLMDFAELRWWPMETRSNPAQQPRPDDVGMSRSGGASNALGHGIRWSL